MIFNIIILILQVICLLAIAFAAVVCIHLSKSLNVEMQARQLYDATLADIGCYDFSAYTKTMEIFNNLVEDVNLDEKVVAVEVLGNIDVIIGDDDCVQYMKTELTRAAEFLIKYGKSADFRLIIYAMLNKHNLLSRSE